MAIIVCDLCGDEPAVLMQTRLDGDGTISAGQSCVLTLMLTMAVQFSQGAEAEEQAAYADLVAELLASLAPSMLQLAKSAVPKPPRRQRTSGQSAGQDGVTDFPTSALVADGQSATPGGTESAPV